MYFVLFSRWDQCYIVYGKGMSYYLCNFSLLYFVYSHDIASTYLFEYKYRRKKYAKYICYLVLPQNYIYDNTQILNPCIFAIIYN